MLHLEPAGPGERAVAGADAGACAGVEASDEEVSFVAVGATTELPVICFAMTAIYPAIGQGRWSFAESSGQDSFQQVRPYEGSADGS